jgi:hypothetical protein
MKKMYVIVSLKHSDKDGVAFWRPDNAGYTTNPWAAGLYSEEDVCNKAYYYNDGLNTIAVCINNSSLPISGVVISLKEAKLKKYRKDNAGKIASDCQLSIIN